MRASSYALSDMIADKLQIAGNAPAIVVYMRQRYWDNRHLWDSSDIADDQEWYQITDRALSVEINENVDQFASAFTVTLANEEGDLSPDNYTNKWPLNINFRGHEVITYARQLYPNNELRIYLGYGDELVPFIHGFIDDAKMGADGQTVAVSCMTSYKHVIHQTVQEKEIKAPNGNLIDVLKFYFAKAGVTLHGNKVMVPGTTLEWIIKGSVGKSGQSFDEIVKPLIDSTFHYLRSNFDGSCTLVTVPNYMRDEPAAVIFDEHVNLTSVEYTVTDQDVYPVVTVRCGLSVNRFKNSFLLNTVTLGKWREEELEVPWADTYRKRTEVAKAHHTKNLHKWRTMNVGVMGDPRLQLWDRVGVREQTTSQTWVFHIKGMQTMISDAGFLQVLDLSVNYGFEPEPLSDTKTAQVYTDIKLKIWDDDLQDGDEVNIFLNNEVVKSAHVLKNVAEIIELNLIPGVNSLVIEGHKTPKGGLEASIQILDLNNNILFNSSALPKIVFPRVNVNKKHYYTKRPAKAWNVTKL